MKARNPRSYRDFPGAGLFQSRRQRPKLASMPRKSKRQLGLCDRRGCREAIDTSYHFDGLGAKLCPMHAQLLAAEVAYQKHLQPGCRYHRFVPHAIGFDAATMQVLLTERCTVCNTARDLYWYSHGGLGHPG